MPGWPKDTMAAKIAFYGDPRGQSGVDPTWYAENLTRVVPPYPMTYAGKPIKSILFHKKCAAALKAALDEIWSACKHDSKQIAKHSLQEFGGSFNYRLIRGRNSLSNHSFGIAIDIAPTGNALGVTKGTMPPFAVAAFKRQGFKWGGDYAGRKDWMHFEAVSSGTAAAAVLPLPPDIEFDDPIAVPGEPVEVPTESVTVPGVKGDPDVWLVQTMLKNMNYSPGGVDGLWGGMTAGALTGFLNDRNLSVAAPTSYEMFRGSREKLKSELSLAAGEGWKRPVSVARATADATKVEATAPEVVPVRRNFFATLVASVSAFFLGIWNALSGYVSDAWNFFTQNKDSIPEGAASSVLDWVGKVPGFVWLFVAGTIGLFLMVNSYRSWSRITESVQSGERQ